MPRLFDIPDTTIHFIQKVVIFAWEGGGCGGGEELHHRQVLQLLQLLRHVLIIGKQSRKFFLKNLFPFYIVSCFTRKKIININKFIVKCERKKW
jgi:hypothetical protein